MPDGKNNLKERLFLSVGRTGPDQNKPRTMSVMMPSQTKMHSYYLRCKQELPNRGKHVKSARQEQSRNCGSFLQTTFDTPRFQSLESQNPYPKIDKLIRSINLVGLHCDQQLASLQMSSFKQCDKKYRNISNISSQVHGRLTQVWQSLQGSMANAYSLGQVYEVIRKANQFVRDRCRIEDSNAEASRLLSLCKL